jgi:glyoxylase-like metal-dependent hydrolase (beta-lactamase superfamily II)
MEMYNVGNRIVNNYLYKIRDGYVLIDTGYEHSFSNFISKIKSKGIYPNDISFVFLTHAHDDHAGFLNQLLQCDSNIKVIVHPKALETLYRGQNSFEGGCTSFLALIFCNLMGFFGKGEHRFPPYSEQFKNRLIVLSEENWKDVEHILSGKIYETPGHTNDSISLLHRNGILFCGDAAMNGLPSRHKITIWVENKKEFIASWKRIIDLHPLVILPAHGKAFEYKQLIKNMRYAENMLLRSLLPKRLI